MSGGEVELFDQFIQNLSIIHPEYSVSAFQSEVENFKTGNQEDILAYQKEIVEKIREQDGNAKRKDKKELKKNNSVLFIDLSSGPLKLLPGDFSFKEEKSEEEGGKKRLDEKNEKENAGKIGNKNKGKKEKEKKETETGIQMDVFLKQKRKREEEEKKEKEKEAEKEKEKEEENVTQKEKDDEEDDNQQSSSRKRRKINFDEVEETENFIQMALERETEDFFKQESFSYEQNIKKVKIMLDNFLTVAVPNANELINYNIPINNFCGLNPGDQVFIRPCYKAIFQKLRKLLVPDSVPAVSAAATTAGALVNNSLSSSAIISSSSSPSFLSPSSLSSFSSTTPCPPALLASLAPPPPRQSTTPSPVPVTPLPPPVASLSSGTSPTSTSTTSTSYTSPFVPLFFVIQGSPGTGKSVVAVYLLHVLVRLKWCMEVVYIGADFGLLHAEVVDGQWKVEHLCGWKDRAACQPLLCPNLRCWLFVDGVTNRDEWPAGTYVGTVVIGSLGVYERPFKKSATDLICRVYMPLWENEEVVRASKCEQYEAVRKRDGLDEQSAETFAGITEFYGLKGLVTQDTLRSRVFGNIIRYRLMSLGALSFALQDLSEALRSTKLRSDLGLGHSVMGLPAEASITVCSQYIPTLECRSTRLNRFHRLWSRYSARSCRDDDDVNCTRQTMCHTLHHSAVKTF